jgi:hypothetical protein
MLGFASVSALPVSSLGPAFLLPRASATVANNVCPGLVILVLADTNAVLVGAASIMQ